MRRSIGLGFMVALIAACSTLSWSGNDGGPREGSSSSLVDHRYPQGEVPPSVDSQIPKLPLRVDLAFEPTDMQSGEPMSDARKKELEVSRERLMAEGTGRVVHAGSAGPGGSGSIDGLILFALLLLVVVGVWRRPVGSSS